MRKINLPPDWWAESKPSLKRWQIQRESRLTCFGIPGYVDRWDFWASYDTEEEAKEALKRLNTRVDPTSRERYQIVDNKEVLWVTK